MTDGLALPPSELAERAGVSRSTMSEHLAKLQKGGFLAVERGGRNRRYRLAGPAVATAVEALAALAPRSEVHSLRQANRAGALGAARTCYGHLAGELGVWITDASVAGGLVEREAEVFLLTEPGAAFFVDLRIERPPRAGKACNDWSERRPHLAGRLGVALAKRLFELDWIRRTERRRDVVVSAEGRGSWVPASGSRWLMRQKGRAGVRAVAAVRVTSRASRGGPGRLWPPRDARDVRGPGGRGHRDGTGSDSRDRRARA